MSGDFWRTPGYSPRPITLLIVYKRLTRLCIAIVSQAFCGRCPTLRRCPKRCGLEPSSMWPTAARRLESWQCHWQLEFNPNVSHKNNPPQRKYVFCGVELEQVDSFPYLGVSISNKLKWLPYVAMTAAKVNESLGIIQRNLWNCPRNLVRETVYTSLVRHN